MKKFIQFRLRSLLYKSISLNNIIYIKNKNAFTANKQIYKTTYIWCSADEYKLYYIYFSDVNCLYGTKRIILSWEDNFNILSHYIYLHITDKYILVYYLTETQDIVIKEIWKRQSSSYLGPDIYNMHFNEIISSNLLDDVDISDKCPLICADNYFNGCEWIKSKLIFEKLIANKY